jgi:hypothetical protein
MSLVPNRSVDRATGLCAGIDAIIKLALHHPQQCDYWRKGRTLESWDQGQSVEELTHYVATGERE